MKEAERSQKQHFIQQSKKIIWETKTPDNIPKWRKLGTVVNFPTSCLSTKISPRATNPRRTSNKKETGHELNAWESSTAAEQKGHWSLSHICQNKHFADHQDKKMTKWQQMSLLDNNVLKENS